MSTADQEPTEFSYQAPRYNTKKANWPMFVQLLDNFKPAIKDDECRNDQLKELASELIAVIGLVLDKSVPKLKIKSDSQP